MSDDLRTALYEYDRRIEALTARNEALVEMCADNTARFAMRVHELESLVRDMAGALKCPDAPCVRCFRSADKCNIPERVRALGLE